MVSDRSIKYTYNVVLISPAYMLILNLNHYRHKWLILESTSIVCPISNMYPRLNSSIGPPMNVSDIPERPCLSRGFQNYDIPSCLYCYFLLNAFPPSKPGTGMSKTKGSRKLVLGNIVGYKKVSPLQPGKYFQVHQ